MTSLKTYVSHEVEEKWYSRWHKNGFFKSGVNKNKKSYTIVMPPPNVTGVLHMGHMLNNTIQDVLIRKARMEGKEACWVPGTDHASIATEAKVVAMLKEKGINKKDLTREEFLKYAWEWKEKYGGIILEQLKKLGCSCDWDRTKFTMDDDLSEAVIDTFIDLYKKELIYRGTRMVNWDPQGKTAVSDEEVIHKEVDSSLYYIRYFLENSDEYIVVATTRPETIFGDVAVCVNPNDIRYQKLIGKKVQIPFTNRFVEIISDDYVTIDFGTGCLKITPAHDKNDFELAAKYQLPIIDILDDDANLLEKAIYSDDAKVRMSPFEIKDPKEDIIPKKYQKLNRFVARKKIAQDLEEADLLVKVEPYKSQVGFSERTNEVIEPKITTQWFVKMKELTQPALKNVLNGTIKLIPEKYTNTYKHWMENVRDWCISRQLWWGHQIPAYYIKAEGWPSNLPPIIAKTQKEAFEKAKEEYEEESDTILNEFFQKQKEKLKIENLVQDNDVLDTWFSSWLWPITVFDPHVIKNGKNKKNADLTYYYPTNDLVTAPEILFFWVARMIMAGYEFMDAPPFKNVYLTGIVRDKQGRKMSKSLGNSPDPLELIKKYGADGVRTGMLFSSPAGNDLLFDEKLCEQGRNFSNKIWNAFKLINGWEKDDHPNEGNKTAIRWFESRFNEALQEINEHYSKFRISDALLTTYKLVWDDFCSWYLEMIKPEFQKPIDEHTYNETIKFFEKILKLIHPFMPFISEELWHLIKEREENECLIVASWPIQEKMDTSILQQFMIVSETITGIRHVRKQKDISPKQKLKLYLKSNPEDKSNGFDEVLIKLGGLESFETTSLKIENAISFVVHQFEFYIPFEEKVDKEEEKEKLQKELDYYKGFLLSVEKKLSNDKFVQSAPEKVIEMEKKKKADAEEKIKTLETALLHI